MRKLFISHDDVRNRKFYAFIILVLLLVSAMIIVNMPNYSFQPKDSSVISHSEISGSNFSLRNFRQTLNGNLSVITPAQTAVNPYEIYKKEPAPMGIADFGIGPKGVPYSYNTTAFRGTIFLNNLSTYNQSLGQSNKQVGFQLNVNLFFKDGGNVYAYWVQDVAVFNTTDNSFYIIDNIWNMSSGSANMHNSTVSGSGTIGSASSTKFYYYLYNHLFSLTYPAKLTLQINATTSSTGSPEIDFMFNYGSGMRTYDQATFIFAKDLTSGPFFLVDGKQYEPDKYSFYDAELIMGGPGGGTQTRDIYSNLTLELQYWNGMNYQYVSNAYNFGSDTAEGICNVTASILPQVSTLPLAIHIQNGSGKLGQIYNAANLSFLHFNAPINYGRLVINQNTYNFSVGMLNLTLPYISAPLPYEIYNSSGMVYSSNISIGKGQSANLQLSKITISENFSSHLAPSNFTWYILIDGTNYSTTHQSLVLYLPFGNYSYSIGTNYPSLPIANGAGTIDANTPFTNTTIFFAMSSYSVSFDSAGLSHGISWSVLVHNISLKTALSNVSIEFYLPNGSYSFSIMNVSGYLISTNATGSFQINGSALEINITYSPISQPIGQIPEGKLIGFIVPAIITSTILIAVFYYRRKK